MVLSKIRCFDIDFLLEKTKKNRIIKLTNGNKFPDRPNRASLKSHVANTSKPMDFTLSAMSTMNAFLWKLRNYW